MNVGLFYRLGKLGKVFKNFAKITGSKILPARNKFEDRAINEGFGNFMLKMMKSIGANPSKIRELEEAIKNNEVRKFLEIKPK